MLTILKKMFRYSPLSEYKLANIQHKENPKNGPKHPFPQIALKYVLYQPQLDS